MSVTYKYQIYYIGPKSDRIWVTLPPEGYGYIGYFGVSTNRGDAANLIITQQGNGYYLGISEGTGASSNYDTANVPANDNSIVYNYGRPPTLWEFAIENEKGNLVADNPTFPLYDYQCYIKDLSYIDETDQRWWKHNSVLTNDQLTGDPISNKFANSDDFKFYITVGSEYIDTLVKSPYILASSNKDNQTKNLELNWENYPDAELTTITQCSPESIQHYNGKIINDTKLFMANQEFSILIDDEVGDTSHNFSILKRFGTVAYIAKFNDLYIFASSKRTISSRSWEKLQKYLKSQNLPTFYPLYNVIRC